MVGVILKALGAFGHIKVSYFLYTNEARVQ